MRRCGGLRACISQALGPEALGSAAFGPIGAVLFAHPLAAAGLDLLRQGAALCFGLGGRFTATHLPG